MKTQAFHERAKLFEESDVWVTEDQKRIPDMAFFTREEILDSANIGNPIPALRMVRVFTSVKSNTTHFETDSFSAAPAVPDLQMMVDELFAR